ncbi:RNA-directed DNA polymerase, eukaryota, reverse transcriptase zinc-binding domain protein [Tanacetum coccineum]
MGVLRILEALRSHFFNGHETNSKKASWVNWKKALASKDRGGLGISSLYAMNRGLMFKWVWRFLTQEPTLWTRVIKAIHGEDGGALKDRYPRVYALESCKQITVGAKLTQPNLSFSFRRNPRGGCEQEQFEKVEDLVKLVSLAPISDRWTWELENTGDFSVASVRKLIDAKMLPMMEYKTRWINYVPIKVNIHTWKVMTDSLPTRFNISRRGICIDSILCANCDTGVETSRHLFFSCCMARNVVNLIIRWWNVPDAEFDSYDDWVAWLENVRLPLKNKKMFEGVFYVMWWLLWSFRNKNIFEDKAPKKAMFFDDVDYAIGDYAQAMLINKNRVISKKFYFHGDGTAMILQTFSLRCIRLHFSLYANAIFQLEILPA